MAFDENGGGMNYSMPVAPAYYGGGNGFGGGFGSDGWWIILLLLCGWGGMGGGFGGYGGGYDFPWLLNGQNQITASTAAGFDHAATQSALGNLQTAVTSGFGDVATQLCGGFAGVNATVNGAQNAIAQQLYTNEIASLNRSFDAQTANSQGFNGVQSGLCDIRYGSAMNTRDIIESQTRSTQAVMDKLCQLELDGVRRELSAEQRENANLRSDLMYARGQASQVEQTAQIRASQATTANQLVNELRSCPIPAQPVYGNTPIFTCGGQGGCGCGCGGSF
jgi:hypothetical protein